MLLWRIVQLLAHTPAITELAFSHNLDLALERKDPRSEADKVAAELMKVIRQILSGEFKCLNPKRLKVDILLLFLVFMSHNVNSSR